MLVSPRIVGLREHNGEVVGDAVWPAIIDRATHDRLVGLLDDPSRRREKFGRPHVHPLVGLVYCASCGGKMTTAIAPRQGRGYVCRKDENPICPARIPAGLLIAGAFVLASTVAGWYFNASRSPTGEIEKSSDLSVLDLRVGDCFDDKDPSADQTADVNAVPCTTEHEYEVFYIRAMGDGSYPTDDAFDTYVTQNCDPAFGAYIGKAYDDSDLDIFYLPPTDDSWRSGDRTVKCAPTIRRSTA